MKSPPKRQCPSRQKSAILARQREEKLAVVLWKRIKDKIPEETITEVLEGSVDPRFGRLLAQMVSPLHEYRRLSWPTLLQRNNISYTEWVQAVVQHGLDDAVLSVVPKMKDVLNDIADDSRSTIQACWKCSGVGEIVDGDNTVQCRECSGKGTLRKPGDPDSRWMFLKSTGFIRGGGGLQLQQNFVNWKGEADESLEALIRETAKVIDTTAETVPAGAPAVENRPDGG